MSMLPGEDPVSTTWAMKRVKIRPSAAGNDAARRRRSFWRFLPPWDRRKKLTLVVTYRGGAEGWYLVAARGSHGVFPACAALEDVMTAVYND